MATTVSLAQLRDGIHALDSAVPMEPSYWQRLPENPLHRLLQRRSPANPENPQHKTSGGRAKLALQFSPRWLVTLPLPTTAPTRGATRVLARSAETLKAPSDYNVFHARRSSALPLRVPHPRAHQLHDLQLPRSHAPRRLRRSPRLRRYLGNPRRPCLDGALVDARPRSRQRTRRPDERAQGLRLSPPERHNLPSGGRVLFRLHR